MSNAALLRQNRRLERLKTQGLTRSTVFVHQKCKAALDDLRSHLVNPDQALRLSELLIQLEKVNTQPTNVSSVRQISPFRYPGGKTWLVPEVRKWLNSSTKADIFVEPFAGGAMAGLTAAADNLAKQVFLCELDEDVAAVWKTIFHGKNEDVQWLCDKIIGFEVNIENVKAILSSIPTTDRAKAFKTIIKNRMHRGGILAAGAGLIKAGEAGRGLNSRWYPETLANRIIFLRTLHGKVEFEQGDAFEIIKRFSRRKNAFYFVDPPYTAGGKNAGKRLYTHNEVDHEKLFYVLSKVSGKVMLTYDDAPEVRLLADKYKFDVVSIPMKNTHNKVMNELIIFKS